jgi:cellulose synthase/poly-beta-1,6-N-acetylglucosamine synthase-like glycosyltransferase
MPEIIYLIFVSGYFILSYLFLAGLKKKFDKIGENEMPSVSVIVAARNEEKNIQNCLQSLSELDYPKEKLEIILVNDESTDRTEEIIKAFISDKPNFSLINLKESSSKLIGKSRPLAEGIKNTKGEIIFITDADCTVPKNWVETTASFYTKDVAMVNGFTNQKVNGAFSGMQAIDFIYLLFVAGGIANLGKPVSCIGNNISFRKSVYDELGGFENLDKSVTEDFLLINEIRKLKKYKVIFVLNKTSLVSTRPCKTLSELSTQKKRWAVGGTKTPLHGMFIIGWAFATNFLTILTPLFFSPVYLYLFSFKLLIDLFALIIVHKELGITKQLKYFPFFFIYQLLYVIILPFVVLFSREINWKGRKY